MAKGNLILGEFKGVNLSKDPRDLEPQELAWAKNVWQPFSGELALRPNFAQSADYLVNSAAPAISRPEKYSIFTFDDSFGKHWKFLWTEKGDTEGRSRLMSLNITAPFITQFGVGSEKPSTIPWQGKLYLFPGGNSPGFVLTPVGGASAGAASSLTITDLGTIWAGATPKGSVATVYRGSFVIAGMSAPDESTIRFCEVIDPDTLLDETKALYIGKGDGDRIVGMVEVSVEGGGQYFEPYLLVFKRRSVWMVQGAPPTSTTAGTLNVVPIMPTEGCIAKETIVKTKRGVIWCSGKNVYMAPIGEKPIAIGDKLEKYLTQLPQEQLEGWGAVVFNNHYRLIVPCFTVSLLAATNVSQPPPVEQWWCDLRGGLEFEPKWWGPQTLRLGAMAIDRPVGKAESVFGVLLSMNTTNVAAWNILTGDVESYSRVEDILTEDPMLGFEAAFKSFDFGDPMIDKIIAGVEVEAFVSGPSNVKVDLYKNNAVKKTTTNAVVPTGFILDLSVLNTDLLGEEFQAMCFAPPNSTRFLARSVQPVVRMVSNSASVTRLGAILTFVTDDEHGLAVGDDFSVVSDDVAIARHGLMGDTSRYTVTAVLGLRSFTASNTSGGANGSTTCRLGRGGDFRLRALGLRVRPIGRRPSP